MARRVGVLALQGGFAAHLEVLRALGLEAVEVRSARDLESCDGIVLPGGESPTQLRLIEREPALLDALSERVASGAPLLATCAGLILAAREVSPAQRSFGWIDVSVRRNAWGRQLHSAEAIADDHETELVLIRAPRIEAVGPRASVELTLRGEPVLVREGARFGATFHPELSGDRRIYERVFGPLDPVRSPRPERERAESQRRRMRGRSPPSARASSSSSSSSSSPEPGSMAAALSISSSQNSRH